MTKIKNICLLIAVTLQFSAPCFSQGLQKDQSGIRIIKLINPVRILKISNNSVKSINPTGAILPEINKNKIENLSDQIKTDMIDNRYDSEANKLVDYVMSGEETGISTKTAFIKENNKSMAVNYEIETLKEYQLREQKQLK